MPTIDNAGQSAIGTSANPVTITSFVMGAGSNGLLMVGVSYFTGTTNTTAAVSGITFNTTSNLTFLDTNRLSAFSGFFVTEFWYLLAPPNATANIVVTFTLTPGEIICGADSWFSAAQTSTFGTVAKNQANTNTSPSVVVTSEVGSIVHDVVQGGDGSPFIVATGTQLWNTRNAVSASRGAAQYKSGAASVTMNWITGTLNNWCNMGVSIHAPASATPVSDDYWTNQLASTSDTIVTVWG